MGAGQNETANRAACSPYMAELRSRRGVYGELKSFGIALDMADFVRHVPRFRPPVSCYHLPAT